MLGSKTGLLVGRRGEDDLLASPYVVVGKHGSLGWKNPPFMDTGWSGPWDGGPLKNKLRNS